MIDSVDMQQVESKSLLVEMLRQGEAQILLGTETDAPRNFFVVDVRSGGATHRFGILSSIAGVKPGYAIRDDKVHVGFNWHIAVLRIGTSLEIFAQVPLWTIFWEFISVPDEQDVFVLAETAVVALTTAGDLHWRIDTDLITQFELMGTTLRLKLDDHSSMGIDLTCGTIVCHEQG